MIPHILGSFPPPPTPNCRIRGCLLFIKSRIIQISWIHRPMGALGDICTPPPPPEKKSNPLKLIFYRSEPVSEEDLYWLSERYPCGNYHFFCYVLGGMVYETAEQILVKHNKDFKQATREVLARWKTKSGGKLEDLSKALQNTGAGGIVEKIEQRMLSRKGLVHNASK